MAAKRIYSVTVEGQYMSIGDASGSKVIKRYTATFRLLSLEAALSVIVSKLLDNKLRKEYEGYVTYRTHRIIKIDVEGPAPDKGVLSMPIESMSHSEMADFCILREVQVDPLLIADVGKAREAVTKAWEVKRQTLKDLAESKKETSKDDELLKLNGLTRDDAPVKMVFGGKAPISTDAHTPGAPVVNRVEAPVEPLDAPLPEPEPETNGESIE